MKVREIVENHLKEKGFDGLYRDDCWGCYAGNLFPLAKCFDRYANCSPGYKHVRVDKTTWVTGDKPDING